MLSDDTINFLETWNKRLSEIQGDSLNDVLEKFSCLYKIYGRLNHDASLILVKNKTINKKGGDKNSATKNVINFLSSNFIFDCFEKNNSEDLTNLVTVLPRFHIKFTNEHNVWKEDVDLQLLNDLQNENKEAKVLSILQIIYYVRCNIEHSLKHRDPHQVWLLKPLNNILKIMNAILQTKLLE